jgi:predicted phosphoribosyltransferase
MAVTVLRLRRAAQIVIAVPIAGAARMIELLAMVNDVVTCTARTIPDELDAASQWYKDFRQVPQESIRDLYERANRSFGKVGTLETQSRAQSASKRPRR